MTPTVLLARTFFARFFESELLPPGLPQVQLVIWSMSLLAAPGFLMPPRMATKYSMLQLDPVRLARAILVDRLFFVTLSMTAMGLVALVLWGSVFPDRRDARQLGVLPLARHVPVVARLIALSALAGIFLLGVNAVPTLLYGPIASFYGGASNPVRGTLAHLAATGGAGVFVFFSLIALQGLLLNIVGRRWAERLAIALQLLFVVALLQQLLFMPWLSALMGADLQRVSSDPVLRHVPVFWFLGLDAALSGQATPGSTTLAVRGVLWTSAAIAVAFGTLAATHGRLMRMALEGRESRHRRGHALRIAWDVAVAVVCRGPTERAVFAFTLRTLARSRAHRMMLAVYVGVALAFIVAMITPVAVRFGLAGFARPMVLTLSVPLTLIFFAVTGTSVMIAIPVDPKANWIFRLLEPADRVAALRGVRQAMLVAAVAPIAAAGAVSAAILWGPWPGLVHGVVCGGMGWLLTELVLWRVRKLPFTCMYFTGRSRVQFWPFYLLAFSNFSFTTAAVELSILPSGRRVLVFAAAVAVAIMVLAKGRARRLREPPGLRFEEEDPDAIFKGFSLSEGLAARAPRAGAAPARIHAP